MTHAKPWFLSISTAIYLFFSGPAMAGGWLGVTIIPPKGVQVAEIFKDSPADRGNIKKGDILLQVDNVSIRSIDHFIEILSRASAGTEKTLAILRKGQALEIKLTLENDKEHISFAQNMASRWQQPTHGSLMPSTTSAFPGEAVRRRKTTPFFPQEEWPSYRPPQERRYRSPPLPSAWLGIAPGEATNGVAVLGVAPNSPAEQAELQVGDIITALNRQDVASPKEFVQTIGMMQADTMVEISFTRKGRTHMLQIQLQRPPVNP